MERRGFISIIIPVYNAEPYLEECVNSVLKQTYPQYELILIDDGSTDASWELIRSYAGKSEKVKGRRKENGGPNSARKLGLEIAEGEFVIFIDADDTVDRLLCEKLIQTMELHEVDMVISRIKKKLEGKVIGVIGGWKEGKYPGVYMAENLIDPDVFYRANMPLGLVANLYRTEILKKIFRTVDKKIRFSEDYSCHMLSLLDSKYVYCLDECLYDYRQNKDSLMHSHGNSNFESEKHLYRFLTPELKKRNASETLHKQLEWMIIFSLLVGGYGTFREKKYLYPFRDVRQGSNLILYGAGAFGRAIYEFVNQSGLYGLASWVDKNHQIYQKQDFPVSGIETINTLDYDYLVIGLLRSDLAAQVKNELEKKGVSPDKIRTVDTELISYRELPHNFWT